MFAKDTQKNGALVAKKIFMADTNMIGKQTQLPIQLANIEFHPTLNKKTTYR